MVIRLHNLGSWLVIPAGKVLELKGEEGRQVTLELNAPAPTRVDVVAEDRVTFIAVIQGYEKVQFKAPAECHVSCSSDDDVFYKTNDGDQIAVEIPNAVSFTRIATRKVRNRDEELMLYKIEENMRRRLDRQARHMEQQMQARLAEMARAQNADPSTGEVDGGDHGSDNGASGAVEGADAGAPKPSGEGAAAGG